MFQSLNLGQSIEPGATAQIGLPLKQDRLVRPEVLVRQTVRNVFSLSRIILLSK